MTTMRNLRIRSRLIVGFGSILTILVAVLAFGNASNAGNRAELIARMEAANAKSALAAAMKHALLQQGIAMRNVGLQSDIAAMQKEAAKAQDAGKRYLDARARLIAAGLSQEERQILEEIAKLDKALDTAFKEAIQHAFLFDEIEVGKVIRGRIDPLNRQAAGEIEKLVEAQQANVRLALAGSAGAQRKMTYLLVLMGAVALALGGVLAVLLTRSITLPLRSALEVAEKVASGELTSCVKVDRKDEIGDLLRALKDMNESLLQIVGNVRRSTETITVASQEIASGNADLSSRTESQASSLEETASSMEQLTSTVRQNADNAREANQLVLSASGFAARGGQVVGQAVATMESIKNSSNRIADIIGVIDGIAFQTNILALNAAVEAARAGEQGRGFAVVAAEVRTLAQRSAGAAKEIKALIDESVRKVDAGSTLVNEAGKTMSEIVSSVKHVADIMGEIAAASQEQNAGIGEVNQAITQMDEVTQRNAALVRQAAATAESMQAQAMQLAQAVSVFKLEHEAEEAAGPALAFAASQVPMQLAAP